ncbi:4Fe-4S binding protein [Paratractidigestivibacter sp.]|uniref:4Fe-4S binding protein n=1 Tax=Paratractidigestivibacter sp. TaxID=2847316 RepID=UPI002ABDAFA6|nr:4Fe-4S binding protein [Paratractidigestivibacter sp.]
MAQKRDFLDDLIDIQSDWQALSNPFGDIADQLALDPSQRKVFNPADYKEKPYANSNRCLRTASGNDATCSRCLDVCPTHAITIHNQSVLIGEDCRKCGVCAAVCPTETISTRRHMPRQVYDQIARAASAYEQCYVTCTRALKRLPKGNEVVLGCVGSISRDLWFSLMADYDNIAVYLPVGICDRCKTTTGEEAYCDAIGTAEEWARASLNLVADESEMTHEFTREYKRSQFMSSAVHSAERLLTRTNPALAGAKAVANKISAHASRIDQLQRDLEAAVGAKTSTNRQRMLTQNRKLMMGALQHSAGLAKYVQLEAPVCDASLCTMCGECAKVCTPRALDLDVNGHITIQSSYCVSCGACVTVCEDGALAMEPMNVAELIVPDKQAEEIARKKAQAKAEAQKYIEQGKKQLGRAADALEGLSDDAGKK